MMSEPTYPTNEPDNTEIMLTRRGLFTAVAAVGGAMLLEACSPTTSEGQESPSSVAPTSPEATKPPEALGLKDPVSMRRARMIISTFENSTLVPQYGYAGDIDDGRGITAGIDGFCSGTGDMNEVVDDYTKIKPDNVLAPFQPRLHEIDKQFEDSGWQTPVASTRGLEGLAEAWKTAAEDEEFRNVQDKVSYRLRVKPALDLAATVETTDGPGIQTAIGQLIMFDTLVQHGDGEDQDGLPQIMKDTADALGESYTEQKYLAALLDVREDHLKNAANEATREAWADSVARVSALRQILKSGNTNLHGRLVFDVYEGDHYDVPAAA